MRKPVLITAGLIALALFAGVAYVLRPPAEASGPLEAVPLAIEPTPTSQEPTAAAPTETAPPATELPTEAAPEVEAPEQAAGGFNFAGLVLYQITQDESEVRFSIDEILRGNPITAVGTTDQIAGEIAVDFDNPANSQLGLITINARTLATDSSNRDRMIRNEILDTAEFEFITFSPTSISGLPESISPGEPITFQVIGDLTIRDVTVEQTFEISASVDESGRLTGSGETTVLRSDYGLLIPSVPSVAGVSDEVILEIDFIALPQ